LRPEVRDLFYEGSEEPRVPSCFSVGPTSRWMRLDKFPTKMHQINSDFVLIVTPDFVHNCPTPVLILPDGYPGGRRRGGPDARAQGRNEHIPVEGPQGADCLASEPSPPPGRIPLLSH